jgi:polyisoprenoid-binding protein YceI
MSQRNPSRSIVLIGVWIAVSLCAGVAARGEEAGRGLAFELDPQATRASFTLGATLHTVHGTIRFRRGSLRFDPATGAASGELVLDAASAETGNDSRDQDMRGKVLESAKHPAIVWTIDRVEGFPRQGARSTRVTLAGKLSIHGASHPLSVPAEVTVAADRRVTATATLKIPYVAWGMRDPSTFVLRVDKEVAVEVRAAGRLSG